MAFLEIIVLRGHPHPRLFLRKSSESAENKRVEFCRSAKEFARISKEKR
jgi:hypothetical protein